MALSSTAALPVQAHALGCGGRTSRVIRSQCVRSHSFSPSLGDSLLQSQFELTRCGRPWMQAVPAISHDNISCSRRIIVYPTSGALGREPRPGPALVLWRIALPPSVSARRRSYRRRSSRAHRGIIYFPAERASVCAALPSNVSRQHDCGASSGPRAGCARYLRRRLLGHMQKDWRGRVSAPAPAVTPSSETVLIGDAVTPSWWSLALLRRRSHVAREIPRDFHGCVLVRLLARYSSRDFAPRLARRLLAYSRSRACFRIS
jgi:hypothetical protein